MYKVAIMRRPGWNAGEGLTTAHLGEPNVERLIRQQDAYRNALERLGLEVIMLDPLPGYPDAYFVEDVAVVLPEVAVVARPGALARRGEEDAIVPILSQYRDILRIEAPGTLDGGDVLMVERHGFIGLTERTNRAGAEQLGQILTSHGYTWSAVPVGDGLHLKSSVNGLGGEKLFMEASFTDLDAFTEYQQVVVPEGEAYAGNTLWVNDHLLTPAGFPQSRRLLSALGMKVIALDMSEVRKMDGGLTCLSLRL